MVFIAGKFKGLLQCKIFIANSDKTMPGNDNKKSQCSAKHISREIEV